ncbi:MAG TPA: CPBP family intramembrane glutamic endopeptidase [Candidatus Sulfotelmatobacter sp.]|nr:CPBP family intramembrane glutamic endopeptidase [Candidatus Sulfotelmatobacter sp.]
MKKCTYCGKEYPDDAVRCSIDEFPLSGGESVIPVAEEVAVRPLLAPPGPALTRIVLTDRQMEIFEVVLVCVIAFGVSVLGSIYLLFDRNIYGETTRSAYAWAAQGLREVACLGLLWYLLQRRGKTLADLGLSWSPKDFGWSIILWLAAHVAYNLVRSGIYSLGLAAGNPETVHQAVGHLLFGGGIFFATILVQFINPFFEELIVRAYLMTEVKRLTKSIPKAILLSTVLQASYHFYQGGPAVVAHGAGFLIFSIYYAKTNRIAPVILAHLYSDAGSTLDYWLRSSHF